MVEDIFSKSFIFLIKKKNILKLKKTTFICYCFISKYLWYIFSIPGCQPMSVFINKLIQLQKVVI